ncbi:hypothetical protein PVK06_029655 [Gossypium arboreum]|uniref:DUF4149 domain-containing protein n=1 Tax=Gossypium arboreum TaxID=29729 RepID=A0ABR0NP86_GOSAR|nr:hypothetical protein PVK06_029655 [Gossypium arboreum]
MNEPWCRLFKFIFPFLIKEKNIKVTSSGRLMAMLIGNPLMKAFFIIFLVSAATATATGDAPFIIAHKKASLNRLKSGAERVSVSVDIYNQGFTWVFLSLSLLLLSFLSSLIAFIQIYL